MPRLFCAALAVALALAAARADNDKPTKNDAKPETVTVTKVDANKGEITVQCTDDKGKATEKTFHLASDVRLLDETGRVVQLAVFDSGNEALLVESAGKVRELRRLPRRERTRSLADSVRTLIEMTDCDEGCTAEVQKVYDMLRKLDTGKNGKIDPQALKAQADQILQERVKEIFNQLDTNKDGKISRDEARGLIKEHFDRIDTNKDGYIELNELLHAAKERRQHEAAEKEKK
jgi:Ca2+-binding EF-hand superfamily protein